MPIRVNSPGWRARRLGTARGAARLAEQSLPGLPSEFLTEDSRIADEVVLEPVAATRGAESAPAAPVLDVSADIEPGRTAVLAIRHPSGALTFHMPVQQTSRTVRGPSEVRFQVPLRHAATRGIVGSAVKAIVIKVAKVSADKVVSLLLPKLAEKVEQAIWKKHGLKEGWLKVTKDSLAAGALAPGKPTSADRSLLFLHGTFSNAASAYRSLAASDFFERVKDTYGDRMFAFDHFSISRTPDENAAMLLDALPDHATTFDVIAHSRGGLVLRTLVERGRRLGASASRFKLNRAVLVASPNEGTPLATPQRWDDTIGWLANILEMFPDNPFTTGASFVANGLVWLANHAAGDLPGLHAMDAFGEPIESIQSPPGPPPNAYSALVANYQPPGDVLLRLVDAGLDQFFGSANDLVVPSEGGWRVDRARTSFIPASRIGCFGPGGNIPGNAVTHVSFFSQDATSDFLVKALFDQPQGLPVIDPRKSLPDRRVARGAMTDGPTAPPMGRAAKPEGRPARQRDRTKDKPLEVTVVNGDLTFEPEALLIGHYHALRLTGTERVMNRLLGGAMARSLELGVYPVAVGTHQIFVNHLPNLERGSFLPRPKAVIVAGLGEEGKLRAPGLLQTVRQAVVGWAQRIAEDKRNPPGTFDLAATLLGSGGTGVTPGDAARQVVQGVYEANELLRESGDDHRLPYVRRVRLIELYLDRAIEAWRSLRMQGEATPGRFSVTDEVRPGTGPMQRPAEFGYRGAEFDFITAETKPDKDGTPLIAYTLDTRRARSEVRGQRAQSLLLNELVATASNDHTGDSQVGRTLFNLLIPVELEPYLAGSGEMQIELDPQTASIPWELLDTNRQVAEDGGMPGTTAGDVPWAIRVKLLRKLRIAQFREQVSDATPEASAIVIGEPACPDEYPRLYGARREAIAVRDCLVGALGKDLVRDLISEDETSQGANARTVVSALFEKPWRLVHVSGHGVPGKAGKPGGVVLSNGTFLGPDEIGNMRTVPELVFVNCCHLGSADAKELLNTAYDRANFASGVAGALIAIGVRCVVAAGWAVDDEAARVFAETFYRALLAQDRFISAVGKAREAAREANRDSNTWAAYQCYGDPDWIFHGTRSETQSTPDYSYVASSVSVELALDRLIVQSRYQGADSARQIESLRALETRVKQHAWGANGKVAELFGVAFVEAGDVETGLRWYETAVNSADGQASIKAAEQLANVRSRLAWDIVDKALRQREDARQRVHGLKRGARPPAERAVADAERALDAAIERGEALVASGLELLAKLTAVGTTPERLNLVGSAHKRRALVRSATSRGSSIPPLREMKASYLRALTESANESLGNLYYPASNALAADIALNAGKSRWKLDPAVMTLARKAVRESAAEKADFWSVVSGIELDQYEALAKAKFAPRAVAVSKAYADLHKRVAAPRLWASVYDTACLVLLNYGRRVSAKEEKATSDLLGQLRGYAFPAATPAT